MSTQYNWYNIFFHSDVRKLARDYPGFNVDLLIDSCIDVRGLANSILQCRQTWSMEKLVDYVVSYVFKFKKLLSLLVFLVFFA